MPPLVINETYVHFVEYSMGRRKLIQALNTETLVTGWKTVTRQTGDSHMTNIILHVPTLESMQRWWV